MKQSQSNSLLNKFKMLGKVIIAGFLAFIILNFLGLFYYNSPISDNKFDKTANKITNYKYESMKYYTRGTEGYGIGYINNDGYFNNFDYYPDMPINILMMGSSQVEAMQVNQKESMSSVLNDMLGEENIVYNIGISGHYFLQNVNNLNLAIEKYKPKDYIIIETFQVKYTKNELIDTLNKKTSETDIDSNENFSKIKDNEIFRTIYRKSPFLKLFFYQMQEFKKIQKNDLDNNENNDEKIEFNEELTNKLLEKIKKETSIANIQPIIFYHPTTTLSENGELILSKEKEEVEKFSELCKNNKIYFLDMSERFKREYEENHILPYGFNNTTVGTGHFNKYGHKMVAEELYQLIKNQGGVQ